MGVDDIWMGQEKFCHTFLGAIKNQVHIVGPLKV